jgi:hypothetical protein
MLKAAAILLFCLLTLGVVIEFVGYSSCKDPPKEHSENSEAQQTEKYNCSTPYASFKVGLYESWRFAHEAHEEIIAVATIFIAMFTIILGLFTVNLAGSTDSLVKSAERTAERQLRAYLSIEKAIRVDSHSLSPEFLISFKNRGQTPAYSGKNWVDVKVGERPLTTILVRSDTVALDKFELTPGHEFTVHQINGEKSISISTEQTTEFNDGKIAFYVFGQLDFIDAFGKARWLKFRFRYGSESVARGHLTTEEVQSN